MTEIRTSDHRVCAVEFGAHHVPLCMQNLQNYVVTDVD